MRLTRGQIKRLVNEELSRLDEIGPSPRRVGRIEALDILDSPEIEPLIAELIGTLAMKMSEQGYGDADSMHTDFDNALNDMLQSMLMSITDDETADAVTGRGPRGIPVRMRDDEQY